MRKYNFIFNMIVLISAGNLILFEILKITFDIFLYMYTVVCLYMAINYKGKYNLIIYLGMLMFFAISLLYNESILISINSSYVYRILITVNIGLLLLKILSIKNSFKAKDYKVLFGKRKKDLERLELYLKQVNIIGIDAEWGNGKTFLIEVLKNNLYSKYEIIEISILVCKVDNLILFLLNELDSILLRNGVLSQYSYRLTHLSSINNSFFKLISSVFLPNTSMSNTLENFKSKLMKLDKPILIIYEDIDRIDDDKIIIQLLAISEKLADKNIKIIYQFDSQRLRNKLLSHEYLEKYIPFTLRLSSISFMEITSIVLKEYKISTEVLNAEEISKELFSTIRNQDLTYAFQLSEIDLYFENNYTIRKVEQYILECYAFLSNIKSTLEIKSIIIKVVYIKRFFPELYEQICAEESLLRTFRYVYNNKYYTFEELFNKYKNKELKFDEIQHIFENESNRRSYGLLHFLGYAQCIVKNEKMNYKNEEMNCKIDRVISNFIMSGHITQTDREAAIHDLCLMVLSQDTIEKQKTAFYKMTDVWYHLNKDRDGRNTIWFMGYNIFENIYNAIQHVPISEEDELKLFQLYAKITELKSVNEIFFYVVSCSSTHKNKILMQILYTFNELKINGNFNNSSYFWKGYKNIFSGLYCLGYCGMSMGREIFYMEDYNELHKFAMHQIKFDYEYVKNAISVLKSDSDSKIYFFDTIKNLEIILVFFDKMRKLLNESKESFNKIDRTPHISITSGSNKKFEELKKNCLTKDSKKFYQELNKTFNHGNGEINLRELVWLLQKRNGSK